MNPCANPNPRVGVLLRLGKASVRTFNILNPGWGRKGLVWFQKHWPEARLRKEVFGYGGRVSREWNAILKARGHPYYEEPPTKLSPIWRAKNQVKTILVLPNLHVAVFDANGRQIPELQTPLTTLLAEHAERLGYDLNGVVIETREGKWQLIKEADGGWNTQQAR